jgi:undecaprenyl diphosphate synthase
VINEVKRIIKETNLQHIAFIMDGNGRWAKKRGLSRHFGHKAGCERIYEIIIHLRDLEVPYFSLYAFSTENWNRPKSELKFLFTYLKTFFKRHIKDLIRDEIRVVVSGDYTKLPQDTVMVIDDAITATKHLSKFCFNICLNYGGKQELVRASKLIAIAYKNNELNLDELDINTFNNYYNIAIIM